MGLIGKIILTGVETASKATVIHAVGQAASSVVSSAGNAREQKAVLNDNTACPSRSAVFYVGANAESVARELLGCGFNSVMLKPDCTLGRFHKDEYGKVVSVTINGKQLFRAKTRFPRTAYVEIVYSDFKKQIGNDIYSKVSYIAPGERVNNSLYASSPAQQSNAQTVVNNYYYNAPASNDPYDDDYDYDYDRIIDAEPEAIERDLLSRGYSKVTHDAPASSRQRTVSTLSEEENDLEVEPAPSVNFCSNCGNKITNTGARFCMKCGTRLK